MIVYLIQNRLTGDKYVGLTRTSLKHRWREHCADAKRNKPFYLHAAIRKHGPEAFDVSELCSCTSIDNLKEMEQFWIKHHNCVRPNGYNLTAGGDGPGIVSRETRDKMSAARKGRPSVMKGKQFSAEARANFSIARMGNTNGRGKLRSEETKRKNSLALIGNTYRRGKPSSPETKARVSAASKGRKLPPRSAEYRAAMSKAKLGVPNFKNRKNYDPNRNAPSSEDPGPIRGDAD